MSRCHYCEKKPVKWVVGKGSIYEYGFCSKTCIANHTIKHFKMNLVGAGQ